VPESETELESAFASTPEAESVTEPASDAAWVPELEPELAVEFEPEAELESVADGPE
jgi:hypothetical protein